MSDWTCSYFKAFRSPEAMELIAANPNAFILLYVIAIRARRTDAFNRHQLNLGEALIGDFKEYGMTLAKYRTAKAHLEKWRFATFKTTNKGTVARITDTRVFDINIQSDNNRDNTLAANSKQPHRNRTTTNKNEKKENNDKRGMKALPISAAQIIVYDKELSRIETLLKPLTGNDLLPSAKAKRTKLEADRAHLRRLLNLDPCDQATKSKESLTKTARI